MLAASSSPPSSPDQQGGVNDLLVLLPSITAPNAPPLPRTPATHPQQLPAVLAPFQAAVAAPEPPTTGTTFSVRQTAYHRQYATARAIAHGSKPSSPPVSVASSTSAASHPLRSAPLSAAPSFASLHSLSARSHHSSGHLGNLRHQPAMTLDAIEAGSTQKRTRAESRDAFLSRLTHVAIVGSAAVERIQNLTACRNLSVLYLYDNRITTIEGLECCKNLSRLYLQNNLIESIQGLDSGFDKLVDLNLSGNKICVVSGLDRLPALHTLHLDNQHTDVPLDFVAVTLHAVAPSLRILRTSGNRITDVAPLQALRYLETLDLSNNVLSLWEPIRTLLHSLTQLSAFNIASNPIVSTFAKLRQKAIVTAPTLETYNDKPVTQVERDFLLSMDAARRRAAATAAAEVAAVMDPFDYSHHSAIVAATTLPTGGALFTLPISSAAWSAQTPRSSVLQPHAVAGGRQGHVPAAVTTGPFRGAAVLGRELEPPSLSVLSAMSSTTDLPAAAVQGPSFGGNSSNSSSSAINSIGGAGAGHQPLGLLSVPVLPALRGPTGAFAATTAVRRHAPPHGQATRPRRSVPEASKSRRAPALARGYPTPPPTAAA
ncbi:Leucine-rich repeat-containing protein 43 [Cladochytrium tenue]|nr:Leucine-rich repeat-containing protein 43 [Cladochytrium tenue]